MSDKLMNRLVAFGVFLVTFAVYMKTLSVTLVFWDVGEFCAAAWLMQVPHPPGSPLFLFLARISSMIPFLPDIAARMHAVSALASAAGVTFLYLVGVKVIRRFVTSEATFDKIITYAASAIGSFVLAFSTTYWDNAIEAEVYGMGMLFVAIILWLALRWWERSDEPHNEKYLLLIAYLIGLSVGVHLLAVLAVMPVLMVVYFRRYEVTQKSFLQFGLISLSVFFIIYPGVVQVLPSLLDGEYKGTKSDLLKFIPPISLLAAMYGVYRSAVKKQKMLHIACLAFLLIVLGYTTYTSVLMRANVDNLPMKENEPKDLAKLTSYLGREQYGDTPLLKGKSWNNDLQDYEEKLFPRRHSQEGMHEATRAEYSSDGDFLWRYQIQHMFVRYVLWNFVGSEGDWQDAGVSWKHTWGIPLLLALIGAWYHFKRDWKMALVFMTTFIIMGLVLDLYQNQQNPQPRERDYFYVGAYYCLALWVAIGIIALVDGLRRVLKQAAAFRLAAGSVVAVCAVVAPINLVRVNWHDHDRSQNYIAWDYSYNLLQSCEQDAILFTNGDNDTFPLWYLQDVEEVRRDIRIVNLSLVNTSWYVAQLKNESPHGAKKIPLSFSNAQIERISPILWKPTVTNVPVPKDVIERFGVTDTGVINKGKMSFTFNGFVMGADTRIARVQDLVTRDIILMNKWERPIYFATTCAPDSKLGLDDYLWMRGMAYRLKPQRVPVAEGSLASIEPDVMERNVLGTGITPSKTPQDGYLYRNLNNPSVYYDDNVQRMVQNYRATFLRLAFYHMRIKNDMEKARVIMARMEEAIPINVIKNQDWRLTGDVMNIYTQIGDKKNFEVYATNLEAICKDVISSGRIDSQDPFMPYRYLLEIYDGRKDYASALRTLQDAQVQVQGAQNSPELKSRMEFYEQQLKAPAPTDTTAKK